MADRQIVLQRKNHRSVAARTDKVSCSPAGWRARVIGLRPVAHVLRVLVDPIAEHAGIAADRRAIVVLQSFDDLVAKNRGVAGIGSGLLEAHVIQIDRAHRGGDCNTGHARRCGALRFRGRAIPGVLRPRRSKAWRVGSAVEASLRKPSGRGGQHRSARGRLGPEGELIGSIHQNENVIAGIAVEIPVRGRRGSCRRRVHVERLRAAGRAQIRGIGKQLSATGDRSPYPALRSAFPPRLRCGKRRLSQDNGVADAERSAARRGNRDRWSRISRLAYERIIRPGIRCNGARAAKLGPARLRLHHDKRPACPVVRRNTIVLIRNGERRLRSSCRQSPDLLLQQRLESWVDGPNKVLENLAVIVIVNGSDIQSHAIRAALHNRSIVERQCLRQCGNGKESQNTYDSNCK